MSFTIKKLSIGTDMWKQPVQSQIRLLLKEQSDKGLHCLPFHLCLLDSLYYIVKTDSSMCRTKTVIISGTPVIRILRVIWENNYKYESVDRSGTFQTLATELQTWG